MFIANPPHLARFCYCYPRKEAAYLMVGRHNVLTESGAVLYFVARLIYPPLYAFGVPLVRSLVWNVAALGMALMLVALV